MNSQASFPHSIVYVSDEQRGCVLKFKSDGTFLAEWGSPGNGPGQFDKPRGLAVDDSGFVFVADSANRRVQKLTADTQYVTKVDIPTPLGLALDASGRVYVASWGSNMICA
ncbi:MAG: 6-bladed beta-propeller [Bacillota bacterium]|nr:6-bladed beta-propeller [Bacillota bacterium]